MRPAAKYYISLTAAAAVLVIAAALFNWNCADGARFAAYLSMAALSSALKIRLPGIHGTISVNFLFVLIGIIDLSFSEKVMLAAAGGFVQTIWQSKTKPQLAKIYTA